MAHRSWGRAIRHLIEAGLLEGREALEGRIRVVAASRSNQVGLLSVDAEPRMVLKRHEIAVDDIDPFEAELGAYRWLGRDEETGALAPRLIAVAGRVLAIDPLSGLRSLHEVLPNSEGRAPRFLEALARHLAVLHSADTAGEALWPRRPWILELVNGTLPELFASDSGIEALAADIVAERALRSIMEAYARSWRARAPIHGDVKFDNIFVDLVPSAAEPRVVLLDWELVGLGCPAWDLAGLLEGLIVPALHRGEVAAALGEMRNVDSTLAPYRARVRPDLALNDETLAMATVVRLVQAAIQLQAMRHLEPHCAESAQLVLAGARGLAASVKTSGPAWVA